MAMARYYANDYTIFADSLIIGYLIGTIILACVFGAVTKHINESKGYEGGFAWGFWLGVIGIIVVACKHPIPVYSAPKESIFKEPAESTIKAPIVNTGSSSDGWKCACGRSNANYVSTCACGRSKNENRNPVVLGNTEKTNIAVLKEYKELLDQGIITQEEFEQKKKEILFKK